MDALAVLLNVPTVGASGAVFGILLGFGVLFPNTQLMLLFPPIPIKAKYFVLIYGLIELVLAVGQDSSNIAHYAHLGGMLFGFLLIRYWRKTTTTLY
jgi:membrane associated rhomboid family serine protease